MAVPASPKLSDLVAEFGGPGNLKAYNRGGTYVPDTGTNAAISTDPNLLALSQFANASAVTGPTFQLPGPYNMAAEAPSINLAVCGFQLTAAGEIQIREGGSFNSIGTNWLTSGVASDCECLVTMNSGTVSTGTVGSWLNLGTTRAWTASDSNISAGSLKQCSFTVQIRKVGTTSPVASTTVSLSSNYTNV